MDSIVFSYLKQFRDDSKYYTHVSQMVPTIGKFRIENQDIENFWEIYCNKIEHYGDKFMSGLAERPNDYLPVLVDIDLRLDYDPDIHGDEGTLTHFYNFEHIKKMVSIYQDVLKYILDDYTPSDLTCLVLEKSKPYLSTTVIKNGFHLHFPYLFLSNHDQDIHLIPRIKKRLEEEKIFADINIEHSEDVVDKSCTRNPWLLYGSRKDINLETYSLTHIFNCYAREITLEDAFKNFHLFNSNDEEIPIKGKCKYYLPRLLSTNSYNKKIFNVRNDLENYVKKLYIKAEESKYIDENMNTQERLDLCKQLLTMISPKRAESYEDWIEMGWILYNVGDGTVDALDLWIDFSSKTSKNNFCETKCIHTWNNMKKGNYTVGTLKKYASEDNPEVYNKWKIQIQEKNFSESLNGGHYDLAKCLYDDYSNVFVCASITKDIWYEFKNHRWHIVEKGITLRSKISIELYKKYRKYGLSEKNGEPNPEDVPEGGKKGKDKILGQLKCATFKDHIMKECRELFYKENFIGKLDSNPNLVCFNNGVLDITTCEFRPGKPEDYCSMSTDYDFRQFEDDDNDILEVKDFLIKIFPDNKLRDYFLEYSAKLLKGGNFAKNFVVMSGEGDNGKSVTIELIEHCLGRYSIKFPTTLLTGKRTASSSACPEVARSRGVRFAVLQEPDGKDTINGGVLKELTGNDSIYTRGLFSEGFEFKPMFKLCFICNKLPRLSSEDQAIWNRVRVLEFESKFPKDSSLVPPTFEEQLKRKIFYRDSTFNEKLPFMKQAFMWIMFKKWKQIQKFGSMSEPDQIIRATLNYRENNDFYLQFINEAIIEERIDEFSTSPKHNGLNLQEMYTLFVRWLRESFPTTKAPSKNEMRDELIKKLGPTKMGKWMHHRERNIQDNIREGNIIILTDDDMEEEE
jgi:P4 family phage/plasmid primase-like protien